MSDKIVVLVTVPEGEAGPKIASALVSEKLAACVNIVPRLRSIYAWKGEICDDAEALLVVKTRRELFARLERRVGELHPYEVPEVIALTISEGSEPYLKWIDEVTAAS